MSRPRKKFNQAKRLEELKRDLRKLKAREKSKSRARGYFSRLDEIRELKKFVWSHKGSHPCVKCGQKHPAALDFHHRDKTEKLESIGTLIAGGASLDVVKAEVDKCDILCANCHRILHYKEKEEAFFDYLTEE